MNRSITWLVVRNDDETVGNSDSSEAFNWYIEDKFEASLDNSDIFTVNISIFSSREELSVSSITVASVKTWI